MDYPPHRQNLNVTNSAAKCVHDPNPLGLAPAPERDLLAAMLAAEKAQLRSSVAVEQLMLRDKELHYYLNTMSSVSTQVQSRARALVVGHKLST